MKLEQGYTRQGKALTFEALKGGVHKQELKQGGEAKIYSVRHYPQLVAKIYHAADPQKTQPYAAKFTLMLAKPPAVVPEAKNSICIVWPTEILYNRQGQIIGFLMPLVKNAREIIDVYTVSRCAQYFPDFTQRSFYRTAYHLALAVESVHRTNYVIGDINESNVLVDRSARVMLIDTDSFQVGPYRCPVGKPEYTPPELQHAKFTEIDRQPAHDCFGLAVLIFQLLHSGKHPFNSHWQGQGEPPTLEKRIRANLFPHSGHPSGLIVPPRDIPLLDALSPELVALFERCFIAGHHDPAQRPSAGEWATALKTAESQLVKCKQNKKHFFDRHLKVCPSCEITRSQVVEPVSSRREQLEVLAHNTATTLRQSVRHAPFYLRQMTRGVRLWSTWTFCSLSGVTLGALFDPQGLIVSSPDLSQLSFSTLPLFLICFLQWAALRHYVDGAWRWILLTILGVLALPPILAVTTLLLGLISAGIAAGITWSNLAGNRATTIGVTIQLLALCLSTGLTTGLILGIAQWLLLRRYVAHRSKWWLPVSVVGWTSGVLLLVYGFPYWMFGATLGGLSGLCLALLLRGGGGSVRFPLGPLPRDKPALLAYGMLALAIATTMYLTSISTAAPRTQTPAAPMPTVPDSMRLASPTPSSASASQPLEPGLASGAQASITTDGRNALIREQPGTRFTIIARLPNGTSIAIVDGPTTVDGMSWWRIRSGATEGWIVEELIHAP